MPCACNSKDKNAAAKKCTVYKTSGQIYKTFTSKVEADAAALRVGGKVKCA